MVLVEVSPDWLYGDAGGLKAMAVVTWQSFGTDRVRHLGRLSNADRIHRTDSEKVSLTFLQAGHLQRIMGTPSPRETPATV